MVLNLVPQKKTTKYVDPWIDKWIFYLTKRHQKLSEIDWSIDGVLDMESTRFMRAILENMLDCYEDFLRKKNLKSAKVFIDVTVGSIKIELDSKKLMNGYMDHNN